MEPIIDYSQALLKVKAYIPSAYYCLTLYFTKIKLLYLYEIHPTIISILQITS